MQTILHTDSATDAIAAMNANLASMGSVVVLTTTMSATQLVTALNAEFYNYVGVSELSVDDNAEDFCNKLNANFAIADGGQPSVKEQYEDEVTDTISKVNALADEDTLTFFLVTDIHYGVTLDDPAPDALKYHFDDSVVNMEAVTEDADIDALLCLGDIIDGRTNTQDSKDEAALLMDKMRYVGKPLYVALGNHDNNKDGNGVNYPGIPRSELKTMFMDRQSQDVNFADEIYHSDYYKDFDSQEIRMIVIYGNANSTNSSYYLYDETTRSFLQSSLAGAVTKGYKSIVITHVPPCSKMNYNNATRNGGETIPSGGTAPSIKDIILNAGDNVIAMFYGHCHQDNVWADPFCSIGTCCNKGIAVNEQNSKWSEDAYMPVRNANNAAADLWDAVVLNQEDKRIDMVRFGAGADRTIHYEPVECAAGASVTLTSKISGGTWGLRTSDQSKATVASGVVTVDAGAAAKTLISVWYKSSDWSVNSNKQLTAGSSIEYWTIKVI